MTAAIPPYNRPLHWLAIATAMATLPLIFLGGMVTTTQAGLSVPDWPRSYGYNMFLFPPSQWVAGIWYEHTHRLMGTVVGFCSVLLFLCAWGFGAKPTARRWIWGGMGVGAVGTAAALLAALFAHGSAGLDGVLRSRQAGWAVTAGGVALVCGAALLLRRPEPRRWVRWLCTAVLLGVLFQGLLGGLRVTLIKLNLAIIHACVAQAFFCLVTLTIVVTGKWWLGATPVEVAGGGSRGGRILIRLAALTWVAIYLQLVVGAMMRHNQAGLAIPDLPLALGKVMPPTSQTEVTAAWFHAVGDHWNDWDPQHTQDFTGPTVYQVWLAFGHRIGAVIVSLFVLSLTLTIFFRHGRGGLRVPAGVLLGLLAAQVTLGVLTVLDKRPIDITTSHVAVGALVMATTFVLAVRSMRLYSSAFRRVAADPQAPAYGLSGQPAVA